jgi:hypothetical protein
MSTLRHPLQVAGGAWGPLLLAVTGGLPPLSCGGDRGSEAPAETIKREVRESDGLETLVHEDERGDVRDVVTARLPADRSRVDLTRVVIRRDRSNLRISFETARAPGKRMMHQFLAYDDRQVQRAIAEVRHAGDGTIRGWIRQPGKTFRPIDTVEVAGSEITIAVPLNRFTQQRVFKWQARMVVTYPNGEIVDTVPSVRGNVGFFPRPPEPSDGGRRQ